MIFRARTEQRGVSGDPRKALIWKWAAFHYVTQVRKGELMGITLISCLCARRCTQAHVYTQSYDLEQRRDRAGEAKGVYFPLNM